jgi:AraC-like DNA-binding protein
MKYEEFDPPATVADYVKVIWLMESESDSEAYPRSQILPGGVVELIFHYADPMFTYENGVKILQKKGFAVSTMKKYIELESNGKTGFIAVRFHPWGARHFFNAPIQVFLDGMFDSKELWNGEDQLLLDAMQNAENTEKRLKLVEEFLLARLSECKKEDKQVDQAVKLIRDNNGLLPIEEVCDQVGIHKKQLERKFVEVTGTTPKVFSRISRFLYLCNHIDNYRHKSLAELSNACGYYDQAHFIKEFREFSGLTPTEYFSKENVYFEGL